MKNVLVGLLASGFVISLTACQTGAVRSWGTPDYQGVTYNHLGQPVSSYSYSETSRTTHTHTYSNTNADANMTTQTSNTSNTYSSNTPAKSYGTTTSNTTNNTYAGVKGDNSKVNERIENNSEWTAEDQGSSDADIRTTQEIRKQVVDQDSFSTNAKNVKVITRNGTVVLKGPVKTLAEKQRIEAIAKKVAGVTNVTNVITVVK